MGYFMEGSTSAAIIPTSAVCTIITFGAILIDVVEEGGIIFHVLRSIHADYRS